MLGITKVERRSIYESMILSTKGMMQKFQTDFEQPTQKGKQTKEEKNGNKIKLFRHNDSAFYHT